MFNGAFHASKQCKKFEKTKPYQAPDNIDWGLCCMDFSPSGCALYSAGTYHGMREYYFDDADAISRLTDHAGYPNSPDAVYYPMHLEWPTGPTGRDEDSTDAPPGNVADNYAWEIRGYYHPDRTGEHFFAVASGDPSELWLSTDDSFDNLEKIANEPTWNGVRNFGTEDRRSYVDEGTNVERLENWSKGIQLQKGKAYAIMARSVEGGGGDNLAVAHSNEMWFEDGMEPIPGSFLSTFDRDSLSGTFLKGVTGDAASVTVTLKDGEGVGATTVDVNSITVKLDGKLVEVTVSQSSGINTATHVITSGFLASGSEHEVEVVWEDSAGTEMAATSTLSVSGYATVASSLAISNVDSSKKVSFSGPCSLPKFWTMTRLCVNSTWLVRSAVKTLPMIGDPMTMSGQLI